MSGFLISFDGLDSSGKNTQTQALIARLRKAGRRVATFTTPDYTTPSGQELRARLQGKVGDWATTPWQEKMRLFAKNRAEHRQEVVDALSVGAIVLYDRYVPSSLAFIAVEAALQDPTVTREQVYGAVRQAEYGDNQMPPEDCSIFLDVPPARALALLAGRKEAQQAADEYTDQLHVQEKLYEEYEYLTALDPERYLRIVCLEGEQLLPPEVIADRVWAEVTKRFPSLKTSSNSPLSGGALR
ncbi:MAG TPA: hypothetical protein VJC05_03445 [Candidatus Andersenbacteria bacterium]|nr:hypothetical protein [Candidatus Andersenbacteria bacterium]